MQAPRAHRLLLYKCCSSRGPHVSRICYLQAPRAYASRGLDYATAGNSRRLHPCTMSRNACVPRPGQSFARAGCSNHL
eukprot:scaffold186630_cov17-Tisochrysis_lutea.AAC.1